MSVIFLVRIRIHESVPLTNGSGSGSCSFRHWLSRCLQKKVFSTFFAYYFLKLHLHHFSKIKSNKEVTRQQELSFSYNFSLIIARKELGFCLLFLLEYRRIRRLIQEAQKNTDPADPDMDPQRCLKVRSDSPKFSLGFF